MGENRIGGIDSEIALTALLAATVTAYSTPSVEIYSLIKILAILLLVLTLLRRMAANQGIKLNSRIILFTTHIMDPATYLSLLYITYVFVFKISRSIGVSEVHPLLFALTTIPILFFVFLGWELTYKAALDESERTFEASADKHRGEGLGIILSRLAKFVQRDRVYGLETGTQSKLSYFSTNSRDVEELSPEEAMIVLRNVSNTVLIFIFVIGSYIVLIPLSGYIFPGSWLTRTLLLLAVLITSGFVRLWYSNYGLVKVEERNGYLTFLGDVVTYFLLCWMVLGL